MGKKLLGNNTAEGWRYLEKKPRPTPCQQPR